MKFSSTFRDAALVFFSLLLILTLSAEAGPKAGPKAGKSKRTLTPPPTKPPLEPTDVSTLPEGKEHLEIFLLMGQSNMKGRGVMPEEPLRNPNIIMMHKPSDQWFLARHPLHLVGNPETFQGHDNAGVGPGLAFAEAVAAARPNTRIALVPCAVGGSRIGLWVKGAKLYEEAIRKAKLARASGPEGRTRIAGALWLQGEADAKPERLPAYQETLGGVVSSLRKDLEIEDLPFLVCTIGEMRANSELQKQMNELLLDLPNRVPGAAAVDARELKGHIGDSVHMDTPTQNEIGRRFARLYLQMPQANPGD